MQTDVHNQTTHNGSRRGAFIVGVIFLLVGSGLSWWGWNILQNAKASSSWPKVQGVVTQSAVRHKRDSDGGDSYLPEVNYEYSVKNQQHENETIKFGENSYGDRQPAADIVARYPIGKKISVSYDPASPHKSVLEPGVTSGSYIVIGIGVLFFFISLMMVPLALILRKR
jgi:hypothetical protein